MSVQEKEGTYTEKVTWPDGYLKVCREPLLTGQLWDRVSQTLKGANMNDTLTLDFWLGGYKVLLF